MTRLFDRLAVAGVGLIGGSLAAAARAAGLVGEVVGGLTQAAGADSSAVQLTSGIDISGSGERIVDPTTMIIQSERIERTIRLEMDVAGQGPQPATMHEIREYKTNEIRK